MANYVGNYADCVPRHWNEYVLENEGEIRPNHRMIITPDVERQFADWIDAGYVQNDAVKWHLYTGYHLGEELDLKQFDFCKDKQVKWWIVKIDPGRFFPMHIDTMNEDDIDPKRYWIALQDSKWGHVFIDDQDNLRDYKRGDVFLFDNKIHGAANVGLEPKISLQILTYN